MRQLPPNLPEQIVTERLILRPYRAGDGGWYAAAWNTVSCRAQYPVQPDGGVPVEAVDDLLVIGDGTAVAARLRELLALGLDELLLTVVPRGDSGAKRSRLFQLLGQL